MIYDHTSLAFCKPTSSPITPKGWVAEPKLDGIRCLTDSQGKGTVKMSGRTGSPYEDKLPHIVQLLERVHATLDGEIVWFDPQGNVDFHRGSGILRSDNAWQRQEEEGLLTYVVFDILRIGDSDITPYSLAFRRELLETVFNAYDIPITSKLLLIEQTPAEDVASIDRYVEHYKEGVVFKDLSAPYPTSKRSRNWLKYKVVQDEDVVIMGYTPGTGKFGDTIGAVVFGQYQGGNLLERGQCSGMDDGTRRSFTQEDIGRVISIRHMGISHLGGFRHPQFRGFRVDVSPEDCIWTV